MVCERCNAPDGRHVDEYKLKGGAARVFCDPCARLTAAVHEMTPTPPPEAQEAEATEEAPEGQKSEGEPKSEKAPSRRGRGN